MDFASISAKYDKLITEGYGIHNAEKPTGELDKMLTLYFFASEISRMHSATRFIDGRHEVLAYKVEQDFEPAQLPEESQLRRDCKLPSGKWLASDFLDLSEFGAEVYKGLPDHCFGWNDAYGAISEETKYDFEKYSVHLWTRVHADHDYIITPDGSYTVADEDGRYDHATDRAEMKPLFDVEPRGLSRVQDPEVIAHNEHDAHVMYNQDGFYGGIMKSRVERGDPVELRGHRTFIVRKDKWRAFVAAVYNTLMKYELPQ